jgi:glycosyltransferase involved in cell wall biosynthesis
MSLSSRVSVALCTCNGAAFIEQQIDTICRQTLPAAEIVLRDDASDDDTVARALAAWERCRREIPQATPELRIGVHARRLGVTQNFASALAECGEDLIALSDQDDIWHPNRLARLVARMHGQPDTLLLHGNARLIDAAGRPLGITLFEALALSDAEREAIARGREFDVLLDRNVVTGAATILRRSLLATALPIPLHWLHDEWLGAIAAALGAVDVEEELLLDYRQHSGNQIGAERETFGAAVRRAVRPRGNWHTHRLARAQELEARLQSLVPSVPAAVIDAVRQKVAHHRVRASLPRSRVRRPVPILREWATGRYRRFGRGIRGIIKDLFESA